MSDQDRVTVNPANQQPAAQPAEGQQEQQGGGFSIWRLVMYYFIISWVINMFFGNKQKPVTKDDILDDDGKPIILDSKIQNLFYEGQEFNVTGYLSTLPYFYYDRQTKERTLNTKRKKVFEAENMTYTFDETNYKDYNITFPVKKEFLDRNKTMFLHVEIEADYRFPGSEYADAIFPENGTKIIMHRSLPVIKFLPKILKKKTMNLLGEVVDEGTEQQPEEPEMIETDEGIVEAEKEPENYIQYLKPELYLYMVPETQVYEKSAVPEQFRHLLRINHESNYYEPVFELTDFWVYKDILIELNETVSDANVTLHIQPYSFWKVAMLGQYDQANQMYKDMGIEQDRDMTIKMFVETNIYLLVLTIFVSLAHTVCEFMAFKNEIHFWKNRDTLRGISVRTLFINLAMSVIVFLYLLDSEETSMMITIPAGIGIAIECWKITKAMKVSSKSTFPYISIEDKDSYRENDTDKYDKVAMTYLSYAMYPLLAIYTVYSLIYEEHKGWYSFVINTLVGAVYVFGFITMTPQLYINYKLKSVEHLPWRALIYRFLNTIIDDLFSFIITMPTMHRISCFRDDIIFLIYLYQRWIYRVDKTRDPYGALGEDQDDHQKEIKKDEMSKVEEIDESEFTADRKGDESGSEKDSGSEAEGEGQNDGIIKEKDDGIRKRNNGKTEDESSHN